MKAPDYLISSIWYKKLINDPYKVIADLFDFADASDFRKDLREMFRAAYGEHYWKKGSPGRLLFVLEQVEAGINAAYLINKKHKESHQRITKEDAFNPQLFCGQHVNLMKWDFFPRMLSFKEFADPYKAISKFFSYCSLKEWKEILKELCEFALSKGSIQETIEYPDSLTLYEHLIKLIEALHFIDVRENHRGGRMVNHLSDK
jgi:hypothetical protein